jgi:hypothetical protein
MYFNTVMLESSWRGVKISSLQLGGVEKVYCPYVPFCRFISIITIHVFFLSSITRYMFVSVKYDNAHRVILRFTINYRYTPARNFELH